MWCDARFGISHYSLFAWSFKCMYLQPSCCFYLFAWVSMPFKRVYQMSNFWMPFKRVNTSHQMTIEWCFLISKITRIAIQCHPSLYYVKHFGTILFAVQRNVFISLLWFLFRDAAGNKHSWLVEIPVERSTFKCNI